MNVQKVRVVKRIGSERPLKLQKNVLAGGKRNFRADKVKKSVLPKIVKEVSYKGLYNTKIRPAIAKGIHGKAYHLRVYKGKHKVRLVVKVYNEKAKQSVFAKKEFEAFQRLKKKGYHVPPTVRLVEIKGKKYVALTDLSRFGNIQTKDWYIAKKKAGEKAMSAVNDFVGKETRRAKQEEGLKIYDSWEYIIDTKKGTVKAFILDLGHYFSPN